MITLLPLENTWWKITQRSRRGLLFCSLCSEETASFYSIQGNICQGVRSFLLIISKKRPCKGHVQLLRNPNTLHEKEQIQAPKAAPISFPGLLKVLMKTKFLLCSACTAESKSEELTTRKRNPETQFFVGGEVIWRHPRIWPLNEHISSESLCSCFPSGLGQRQPPCAGEAELNHLPRGSKRCAFHQDPTFGNSARNRF